jgi:hypothetical protein
VRGEAAIDRERYSDHDEPHAGTGAGDERYLIL